MQCKVSICSNWVVQLYMRGNIIIISSVNGPVQMCNKCSETVQRKMTQIISWITIPQRILLSKYNYHSFQYSNGFTAPHLGWWHCSHTHTNSILKPWLNLISASFGERAGVEMTHFFLLWLHSRKWDPRYNVKDRAWQAGESKLLLSDKDPPEERRAALIWKYTEKQQQNKFFSPCTVSAQTRM